MDNNIACIYVGEYPYAYFYNDSDIDSDIEVWLGSRWIKAIYYPPETNIVWYNMKKNEDRVFNFNDLSITVA